MIIIYGCGGHARSIADVLKGNGIDEMAFIDKNAQDGEFIYGNLIYETLPDGLKGYPAFLAIGDNVRRREVHRSLVNFGFCTVISKNAYIGINVFIDEGTFIANYAYIGPDATIGKQTIINTKAIIEHESKIGDFCHIASGAVIAGRCNVGSNVFIGAGATVIDKISIHSDVVVGANSTVISDLKEEGIYVGSPAKKIR